MVISPGEAEAGVVFEGQNVEGCEIMLVADLEAVDAGFQTDPDTPAQPVVAQLVSLLEALLGSQELIRAMETTNPKEIFAGVSAMSWPRLLSQALVAILQLSSHCSDAVVAACQEGDVVSRLLPTLLQVAIRPVSLPALLTAQVSCNKSPTLMSIRVSLCHEALCNVSSLSKFVVAADRL